MEKVPDGVLWRREQVRGDSTNGEMGTQVKTEVVAGDVAVDGSLEGSDIWGGDGRINLSLGGPSVCDVGVEITGQASWIVVEGIGWERAARESDANVNWCEGGLVVGEWARCDAATTSTVRDGEVGAEADGSSVVGKTVA